MNRVSFKVEIEYYEKCGNHPKFLRIKRAILKRWPNSSIYEKVTDDYENCFEIFITKKR